MPRSLRAEKLESMRLLAEHHLEDVRYSRKGREIVAVKHTTFGWISPSRYYALQHLDRVLPDVLAKVLEGGYRLKSALWSTTVGGATINLPVGGILFAGALGLYTIDKAAGKQAEAILDLAALALPFGELYLLFRGISIMSTAAAGVGDQVGGTIDAITGATECKKLEGAIRAVRGLIEQRSLDPFLLWGVDLDSIVRDLEAKKATLNCP